MTEQNLSEQPTTYRKRSPLFLLILFALIVFLGIWNIATQKKMARQQVELTELAQQQQQFKMVLTEARQLQQNFADQISLLMRNNQKNQTQFFLQEISLLLNLAHMELKVYQDNARTLKILDYVEERLIQYPDKQFQPLLEAIQSDKKTLQQEINVKTDILKTIQQLQQALQNLSVAQEKKIEAAPSNKATEKIHSKWSTLEKLIVIRRFDGIQPRVLDEQSKLMMKQQLLSLSTLLVWSFMTQQNEIFQQTLQQIKWNTEQYFSFDQTSIESIQQQIQLLQKSDITTSSATIENTMNALLSLETQLRKS